MIKIKSLLPLPQKVEVGTQQVEVKGITLAQLGFLLDKYREDINLYLSGVVPDFNSILQKAPEFVSTVLAMGLGAEGQEEDIKSLPATIQLEILMVIWKMTVPDLKKVLQLIKGLTTNLEETMQPTSNPPSSAS